MKRKWCRGGRDGFHRRATRPEAFLRGCASCSWVPTFAKAHTPHSTYAHFTHSQLCNPSSAVPNLRPAHSIGQETVTSFFLCSAQQPDKQIGFPLHLDYGEQNGWDKLNVSFFSIRLAILLLASVPVN